MKYVVFTLAALGIPPLAFALFLNRRWMKYAIWAMIAALTVYQGTAINFFSHEEYRGSARGMEVSVVYLIGAAILLAAALKRKMPKLVPSTGACFFVVYFLLCLPSLHTAENMLFSWMEIWKMIMLYIVYLSIRAYLNATDDVKSLMRGFAVFVFYNFILVVKGHFAGVYQPYGSFPHQNCLAMAMHLFANLFFAHYLAVGFRGSKLSALAFVCASACIVRTYSRGAIAMMPLAFFVTFVLSAFVSLKVPATRLAARVLPIALVGAVAVSAMLPRVISRFKSAPEASGNTRIELALCAKEMMLDEPWCGVGINNWGIKINPPYEYAELAGRNTNRGEDFKDGIVETVYLLVGAECGIPALMAMLLWFAHYLVLSISLAKRLAGTPYAAISAGIAGGLVASYVQSCLEWVLRQQMNLILLMMFFALLDHIKANARRLAEQNREREGAK